MATTALDGAFAALTAAVAAEREAAGTLAYRLTTVRLLLEAGEPQLLSDGLAELELAAAHLDAVVRRRQQARLDLVGPLALEPDTATLAELAARAPAAWAPQLAEHRAALSELVERIRLEAARQRTRAQRALADVRGRLEPSDGRRHLEALPRPGEHQLVADLDLGALVTELRVREVTYEGLVEITTALPGPELTAFVGIATVQH